MRTLTFVSALCAALAATAGVGSIALSAPPTAPTTPIAKDADAARPVVGYVKYRDRTVVLDVHAFGSSGGLEPGIHRASLSAEVDRDLLEATPDSSP